MKKSRRTYNGVHLNKKSNTQDVVEQSLTIYIIYINFPKQEKAHRYHIDMPSEKYDNKEAIKRNHQY